MKPLCYKEVLGTCTDNSWADKACPFVLSLFPFFRSPSFLLLISRQILDEPSNARYYKAFKYSLNITSCSDRTICLIGIAQFLSSKKANVASSAPHLIHLHIPPIPKPQHHRRYRAGPHNHSCYDAKNRKKEIDYGNSAIILEGIKDLSSYYEAAGYTIQSRIVQLNLDQVGRLPRRQFYCSLQHETSTHLLALPHPSSGHHRYLLVGVINHGAAQA